MIAKEASSSFPVMNILLVAILGIAEIIEKVHCNGELVHKISSITTIFSRFESEGGLPPAMYERLDNTSRELRSIQTVFEGKKQQHKLMKIIKSPIDAQEIVNAFKKLAIIVEKN